MIILYFYLFLNVNIEAYFYYLFNIIWRSHFFRNALSLFVFYCYLVKYLLSLIVIWYSWHYFKRILNFLRLHFLQTKRMIYIKPNKILNMLKENWEINQIKYESCRSQVYTVRACWTCWTPCGFGVFLHVFHPINLLWHDTQAGVGVVLGGMEMCPALPRPGYLHSAPSRPQNCLWVY